MLWNDFYLIIKDLFWQRGRFVTGPKRLAPAARNTQGANPQTV